MVVLPLRNVSEDPEETLHVSDGITRAVIFRLTQAGLRVTPWDTALRFRDDRDAQEIASVLNVDAVLTGDVMIDDTRLVTTLALVEAESGLQTWTEQFEEPGGDIFEVQTRIASGAARSLRLELTGETETLLAEPESTSVEAYELYLEGAGYLLEGNADSAEIARRYFERAIAIDPALAEAHVGLGAVYIESHLNGWGGGPANVDLAEQSYRRALARDPLDI